MSDKEYRKEDAMYTLSAINEWTRSADSKTSILMAFISLLLGFTLAVFDGITYIAQLEKINFLAVVIIMLLIIYVLSAAAAIVFSSLSLAARLKFKNKGFNSIIYFGDIAELSGEEFLSKTAQMTENDIVKDLKTQIVINSRISKRKLKYFNLGLISSIVLFASAIILLIIIRFAV